MRIICFGPGPQFKGGLANYNTSLAKAFSEFDKAEVHIVSWTNQYPSIVLAISLIGKAGIMHSKMLISKCII